LTLLSVSRYALCMTRRLTVSAAAGLVLGLFVNTPVAVSADSSVQAIPSEDYALYDQAVTQKFLTSETRLVVIERLTVSRLSPNQDGPMTIGFIQEQSYFDGVLPPDLVRDFAAVNQQPTRLEGRFQFGVRYRFVSGNSMEEPEVSLASPVTAVRGLPVQVAPVLDRLAFSRVGRTLRDDQALLYVENNRPDGSGAGFLVWFRRQGREWIIFDTDVVWTIRGGEEPENGPPLAP